VLVLAMFAAASARAVETYNYGYVESTPALTDAIRLSTRIGYTWFTAHRKQYSVENGAGVPYAYHDGYVGWVGAQKTPAEAVARWKSILDGNGDPWTGEGGNLTGQPTIILLDEVNSDFKDNLQGPALRSALHAFANAPGYNKSQIVVLASPDLSMGSGVIASNYNDLIYCANNYCRMFVLEVYVTHQGFNTGYDPGESTFRGTGDTYLANRLTFGIRNWTTTMGVSATKVAPMILVSNRADLGGVNFYKFMNRSFWFMANGWYNGSRTGTDSNIRTAMRHGVSSYSWYPGTGDYQLSTGKTTRDIFFEKYNMWYCVGGKTAAHSDGLAPQP